MLGRNESALCQGISSCTALYFHSAYENGLVIWHAHLSGFLKYQKIGPSMASLRCPVRSLAMAACSGTF